MSKDNLQPEEYIGDELELFSYANNWKGYWASKVKPLTGVNTLEVGAGIGSNTQLLKRPGVAWSALEPDPEQCQKIATELGSREDFAEIEILNGTLADLSANRKFDTILYIDVLEHIADDAAELILASQHLESQGRVVVLAPAHQRLFSPFDEAVGHYRRYDKKSLSQLKPVRLVLEDIYYLDSIGYLASWFNARLLKSRMPTLQQIRLWDSLMVPMSKIADRAIRFSFGKTVVMILRKN